MNLSEYQRKFTLMVGKLIIWMYDNGYEATFGDAYRTIDQAAANAAAAIGIKNSLHCKRLAVDLNLFKDGVYLKDTKDYKPAGDYWVSLGGSWGGNWKTRKDGNHFSLSPDEGRTQ